MISISDNVANWVVSSQTEPVSKTFFCFGEWLFLRLLLSGIKTHENLQKNTNFALRYSQFTLEILAILNKEIRASSDNHHYS